jgi:uncharacterized membrane protein
MNKTEYINTLKQELEGLPIDIITATLAEYEEKFAEGQTANLTETEIIAKLLHPRVIAAQKRAGTRFENLKKEYSAPNVGSVASAFVALLGILVLNFFMVIPAVIFGVILFAAYAASFFIYGAGIVMMSASFSGVPQMQLTLPQVHYHGSRYDRGIEHIRRGDGVVNISVNSSGVVINEETKKTEDTEKSQQENLSKGDTDFEEFHRRDRHQRSINIKNNMTERDIFASLGILLAGIGLLLLCLWLTTMTLIGFKKYLFWNFAILKSSSTSH